MKHLVYLIDGTWVFAGRLIGENKYSNIYHLSNALSYRARDGQPQIVHYIRGIGSTKGLRRFSSGGFGYAINENVQDIYLNICANYEAGDNVYLFGFSRGAVVARAVCDMLDFGALKPDRMEYLGDVWNCFRLSSLASQGIIGSEDSQKFETSKNAILGKTLDSKVRVKFLGLFDTVLGGRRMTRNLQELNVLPGLVAKSVDSVVQLHAIDETRPFFRPQPFKAKNPQNLLASSLEQIWLPGVHSDIGGGYNDSGLSELALLIMIDRLIEHTNLDLETTTLERRVFEDAGFRVHVNSEYRRNGLWFLRGLREQRKIPSTMNSVHPLVDVLRNVNIQYKGKPARYDGHDFSGIPRAPFFVSPRFRDREIAVLK
jgi:uncharacterized protein (DUF2235 family)